jgi:hypothetical protein
MWVSGFPTLPSFWTSKSRPQTFLLDHACKCFHLQEKVCGKLKFEAILGKLSLDVEALTKQNGVQLLRKFKKKVKTNLPYLSFYKKKPETHIFFFLAL